jgi:pilus assembly protein Flp/PilA
MTSPRILQRFATDTRGVTAIEYGFIAALIAVVIIGAVTAVGDNLNTISMRLVWGVGHS